ncbi:MAG: hypothetical protein GX112_06915 [Clostridiaceae bacterium]|nr:hypothetical protein [Clostridiaceae bacterium]
MRFSIARRRITPDEPVMQCGFAARTHLSEGVHDDLFASMLLLEDDKRETVALVSLDVLYADRAFADEVRAALKTQCGLTRVILNYTHTHGAVTLHGARPNAGDTDGFPWNSQAAIAFSQRVGQALLDMAQEALAGLADGQVALCRGQSRFGVSRRYPLPDGTVAWRPYDSIDAIDPDLVLVTCTDSHGQLKGLVYHYACHPTTLGSDNVQITAEYPGAVRRLLEAEHPGLTVLFLQGCGADIKPRATAEDDYFKSCSFAEMETAAAGLAGEIQALLRANNLRPIELDLAFHRADLRLFAETWTHEQWQALLDDPAEPDYIKSAIRRFGTNPDTRSRYLPYEMAILRLDSQTCLVALENEVVSAIGKKIKRLFGQDVLVLGYSNSCVGYIPSRQALREGGYEADSFKRLNLTGPLAPETEDILVGHAAIGVSDQFAGPAEKRYSET